MFTPSTEEERWLTFRGKREGGLEKKLTGKNKEREREPRA